LAADNPDGFKPHTRKSPLTEPWEPLYSKQTDTAIIIGLRAAKPHCNSRGFVHGGLISALADNAMGLSCANHYDAETLSGLVTLSLHVDFTKAGQVGDWIEFVTTTVHPSRTIAAAQGHVLANGNPIALMGGHFRILKP